MSGKAAARIGDLIDCKIPQTTPAALPHAPTPGLPIIPSPGVPTVFIGGPPAARIGDKSICLGPAPIPNPIVKGAFPVPISNSPAARESDMAAHPGSKISQPCCPTVEIGLAGTSGNPWAGEKVCVDLKEGRNPPPGAKDPHGRPLQPKTPHQSYNNCAVESARGIVNAKGGNVAQEAMLNRAFSLGANKVPGNLYASGGAGTAVQAKILNSYGVGASQIRGTASALQVATAQGKGVIATLDAGARGFWPPGGAPPHSGHAVQVTGANYDDNGKILSYIVNDTGYGKCSEEVEAGVFENAVKEWQDYVKADVRRQMGQNFKYKSYNVATHKPIW